MITLSGFGVSNYYNKIKLVLLEKRIPFQERLIYPWQREEFLSLSPMGKIPFLETVHGGLSESQVIVEYLEETHLDVPLHPTEPYARAKCRELIQHLELNCEWVVRRLYKEAFFGGVVSDETKAQVYDRLPLGLDAVNCLASFGPFILGETLTMADCAAYVHFTMIKLATGTIYGEDLLDRHIPRCDAYMHMMDGRPHIRSMMAERAAAMTAFRALGVPYDG